MNIYEKNDYPGGHTNTVEFRREPLMFVESSHLNGQAMGKRAVKLIRE